MYVYDPMDRLAFVLQPMYQSTADADKYAFRYKYDSRGRCVEKKVPGADAVTYVYDNDDRLTFSQDGVQRASNKWTYYLYDALDRLTEQGECTNKNVSSEKTVLLQHYYDDYSFRSQSGFNNSNFPAGTVNAKGLLTATVTAVLGSTDKQYAAYYYDYRGRVVKEVRSNLLGGYDVTSTSYTFTSHPSTVTRTHTASGKTGRTEVYTYTYDNADRLTKVAHKLGGTQVTLAGYTYDDLERLQTKSLHGSTSNKVTYAYNIRSWLTGISGSQFTQSVHYTDGSGTFCYSGNISSLTWKAGNESVTRGYKFSYDNLNRLTTATYGEGTNISSNANRFTEKVTGYDKNGNITGLQRYGQTSSSAYGLIDNLTYTLSGNQVTRVDDATTAAAYNNGFEFKDAVKQANEYTYDKNGNLTKDLNKNVTSIQYNSLNLPSKVTFGNGNTITYTYAADGTKLRTVHKTGSTTTTTDYCGSVVYENGTQKYLLTEEGYVTLADSKYHYYLKDHQGNNRVVISSTGTVEETNHYYPFGGAFAVTNNVQPYKYNGKEFDNKNGLNWYDYGARHYDAALGRFVSIDRFAEKYPLLSPYQYAANNPVVNVDVNGDSVRVYTETDSYGHSWLSTGEGEDMVVYSYGRFNGTYKGQKGINFANDLGNGDGVLLRMTGLEAEEYMSDKESLDMDAFVITDVSDKEVNEMLDAKFYSSDKLPDNPKSIYYNAPYAHIIDSYKLLDNNCTTFVSDVLNQLNSNALETVKVYPIGVNDFYTIPVKERFILPFSLQQHLNQNLKGNGVIHKIR